MSTGFNPDYDEEGFQWYEGAQPRPTSRAAYRAICSSGLISVRRREVYQYIYDHQDDPPYHFVIEGDLSRYFPNRDSERGHRARVAELGHMGVIEVVGERVDPESHVTQQGWRLTGRLPVPWTNPRCPPAELVVRAIHRLRILAEAYVDQPVLAAYLHQFANAMAGGLRCDMDALVPMTPQQRHSATVRHNNQVRHAAADAIRFAQFQQEEGELPQ